VIQLVEQFGQPPACRADLIRILARKCAREDRKSTADVEARVPQPLLEQARAIKARFSVSSRGCTLSLPRPASRRAISSGAMTPGLPSITSVSRRPVLSVVACTSKRPLVS